ncbi:thioredoxin family protein [Wolbachia endosymbiont of Howardula sp.]|uniref:thioredoxin family protein n=1 Tax=Wolbachia endosymbiont of Howardula sp. TaxID=2916816 RepID=UPI00217D66BF|nr:thioredoxin family protein [Wolbachia endosymbiont of Howardula sp.]UWI83265.1 thioredoxin family protein [Wolbachia endosymbiont of Howardula sp.]
MVALDAPKADFTFVAQDFNLLGVDGKHHTLNDCSGVNGLIVMFICNHCPYVLSIIQDIVKDVELLRQEYQVNSVAIMSNDIQLYPEDSFINMITFAHKNNFTFPYLIDSTQKIARAYSAVCTPDFFGFNSYLKLCYRGRFNETSKEKEHNYIVGSSELFKAMKLIAETNHAPLIQTSSIGCSIKWSHVT